MIKRFLIIFSFFSLFLMSPFLQGKMSRFNRDRGVLTFVVFAQEATDSATSSATPAQPSWWDQFWSWVFGLFTKTDYTINTRTSDAVNSDMTDYGDKNEPGYKEKHSFAGSRLTDSNSQTCLKGNVIKNVVLGIDPTGYPNSDLSQICLDSTNQCVIKSVGVSDTDITAQQLTNCSKKNIKDLAHYFVQISQQFYCDSNTNVLINTEQNIIDQVKTDYSTTIPDNEINCYQKIYDDFYLTPKDSTDVKEVNTTKMMQTPISADNQNSQNDSNQIKNQVDKNFSPDNSPNSGLSGLRPASW